MKHITFFSFCLVLLSCVNSNKQSETSARGDSELKFAKGFSLEHVGDDVIVEVYNPWNNYSVLESYVFSKREANSMNSGNHISVPISTASLLSSTYIGMFSMLNAREAIISSSNANWICDSILYKRYLDNKIVNLGNDMTISAEAVIAGQPDVVVKYIYQSEEPMDQIIRRAGLPIIYIIEFMEEHPLGRAEWIKLVGVLLDKEREADSLFSVIEGNYNRYAEIAKTSKRKPSVVCGTMYKGTWYAVGGKSYIAHMLRDANAEYFWDSDSSRGSIPLSFEVVIQNQGNSDFWINANANTLSELLAIESRSNVLKAFNTGQVYHYNKHSNKNGGHDFYETGVVRPDLVLKDLLVILHPGLIDAETNYYKKLE